MSDDKTDNGMADTDAWVKSLSGEVQAGPEDAVLIRAVLKAHEKASQDRLSDEDMASARDRLRTRLEKEDLECSDSADAAGESNVVKMVPKGSAGKTAWSRRDTGMLLAASAAFVAVGILTFGGDVGSDGECPPGAIVCYGEIDTIRGSGSGENPIYVSDPDAYGRELAALLTEKEIPHVLFGEAGGSPERVLSVQVDGIPNPDDLWDVLRAEGIHEAPSSVIVIRLMLED